jgi:hypothetical protein
MIIDWNNYRVYFKKIEKADTDQFTYTLVPKKLAVESDQMEELKELMGPQYEEGLEEFKGKQKPKVNTHLRSFTVLFENPRASKTTML